MKKLIIAILAIAGMGIVVPKAEATITFRHYRDRYNYKPLSRFRRPVSSFTIVNGTRYLVLEVIEDGQTRKKDLRPQKTFTMREKPFYENERRSVVCIGRSSQGYIGVCEKFYYVNRWGGSSESWILRENDFRSYKSPITFFIIVNGTKDLILEVMDDGIIKRYLKPGEIMTIQRTPSYCLHQTETHSIVCIARSPKAEIVGTVSKSYYVRPETQFSESWTVRKSDLH